MPAPELPRPLTEDVKRCVTSAVADHKSLVSTLHSNGVCIWCCLRFCGRVPSTVFHPRHTHDLTLAVASAGVTLTPNLDGCTVCLGILSCCSASDLGITPDGTDGVVNEHGPLWDRLATFVSEGGWKLDGLTSFDLTMQTPLSLPIRERQALAHLHINGIEFTENSIIDLREAMRSRIQPCLEAFVGCARVKDSRLFTISLSFSTLSMQADCELLENLPGVEKPLARKQRLKFKKGRQGPRSFTLPTWNVGLVTEALKHVSLSDIAKYLPCPPQSSSDGLVIDLIVARQSVFIAGRYRKLSREWPQSSWQAKFKSSVADVVTDALYPIYGCTSKEDGKFRGAGREDADVRMLESGRPFILELLNPRTVTPSAHAWAGVEDRVRELSDGCVEVFELKEVTKEDNVRVTAGEQDKRKTYECVVWVSRRVNETMLEQLRITQPLSVQQRTPLRVLHRRANLVRPKEIYAMTATMITPHFIVLRLTTGAGTYVKEFVHGDYGRTTPNIGSILGCEADIIQLDVLSIQT